MFDGIGDGFFGDLFGGGGSGIFDSLFGWLFDGGGGEAMADILGGVAGRNASLFAGEGFLGRLLGISEEVANLYFDYQFYKDLFGYQGNYKDFETAWKGMGQQAKADVEHIRDVVKGHSFILQQLKAHKTGEGMAEILAEYEKLGLELPSEELTQKVRRGLSKYLHPDQQTDKAVGDSLMKELNISCDALKDPAKVKTYKAALEKSRSAVEELFEKVGKINWKSEFESAVRNNRLKLPGSSQPHNAGSKWFSELSGAQKGLLIFGVIATCGMGAYFGAKALEKYKQKHRKEQQPADHRERIQETRKESPAMAGGIS